MGWFDSVTSKLEQVQSVFDQGRQTYDSVTGNGDTSLPIGNAQSATALDDAGIAVRKAGSSQVVADPTLGLSPTQSGNSAVAYENKNKNTGGGSSNNLALIAGGAAVAVAVLFFVMKK